jgi:endonuclease I
MGMVTVLNAFVVLAVATVDRKNDIIMGTMRASRILKEVCPLDVYSNRIGENIWNPTREHVVPRMFLPPMYHNDLNNIWVCNSKVNSIRSAIPYGLVSYHEPDSYYIDGCTGLLLKQIPHDFSRQNLCVKNKILFMPPFHSRGAIARTCMYMMDRTPGLYSVIPRRVIDIRVLTMWHYMYPVTEWEVERSKRIAELGYPVNNYVLRGM